MDNGSSVDGSLYTGHNRPNKPTFKDGESEEKMIYLNKIY